MKRSILAIIAIIGLGLLIVVSSCGPAGEVKPADFYKGKTIDYTITSSPGGSTDLQGRIVAKYLQQYTGATCVITNRRGGGGAEGVMWVYNAQPDGLKVANRTLTPHILNKIMEDPSAEYELNTTPYLTGIGSEPFFLYVMGSGPYQSIAALQAGKNLRFAGTSPRGNVSLGSMSVGHLLDLDVKVVTGYEGVSAAMLAVQQGEVAGTVMPLTSGTAAVESGQLKRLFLLGTKRSSALPDVPTITELLSLSSEKSAEVQMWQNMPQSMVYFTTPGTPQDRVDYLDEVFQKIVADPAFLSELDQIAGYPVRDFFSGKEVQKLVNEVSQKAAAYKTALDMLVEQYAVVQ